MKQKDLINYNGNVLPAAEPVLTAQNRAFRYGDGLFESIRIIKDRVMLFPLHYQRMLNGLQHLKINIPDNFTEDFCKKLILDYCEQAGITENARIRLSFFRKAGGLFLPATNEAEYLIEGQALSNNNYNLNSKGLTIDIYTEIEKHFSMLAAYKTNNAVLYVMAAIYREEQGLDDCLVINSRSRVIESTNANIFLVKGNKLYTPPLAEGCVAGVMREFILYIAAKNNISVHETPLTLEELFEADEAFLTNAIYGIRWIEHYKSKVYTNSLTTKLARFLEEELTEG